MDEIILEAILRANKLGARGQRVIAVREPETASESPFLKLTTDSPIAETASEREWYE